MLQVTELKQTDVGGDHLPCSGDCHCWEMMKRHVLQGSQLPSSFACCENFVCACPKWGLGRNVRETEFMKRNWVRLDWMAKETG